MKKFFVNVMLLLGVLCFVVGATQATAAEVIKIAGSTSGGGLFPLSTAVFKIIKLHLPQYRVGPPQITGGSVENTRLLGLKEVQFGYTSELEDAYQGVGKWEGEKYGNLRSIYTFPMDPSRPSRWKARGFDPSRT